MDVKMLVVIANVEPDGPAWNGRVQGVGESRHQRWCVGIVFGLGAFEKV